MIFRRVPQKILAKRLKICINKSVNTHKYTRRRMTMEENKVLEEEFEDSEDLVLTLEMEDGSEEDCIVLTIFPMDDKQYIALVPVDQADSEDSDIYLYGYTEDEDGNPILSDIEDDDEFEAVCDRFDEVLDEEDFDEL